MADSEPPTPSSEAPTPVPPKTVEGLEQALATAKAKAVKRIKADSQKIAALEAAASSAAAEAASTIASLRAELLALQETTPAAPAPAPAAPPAPDPRVAELELELQQVKQRAVKKIRALEERAREAESSAASREGQLAARGEEEAASAAGAAALEARAAAAEERIEALSAALHEAVLERDVGRATLLNHEDELSRLRRDGAAAEELQLKCGVQQQEMMALTQRWQAAAYASA